MFLFVWSNQLIGKMYTLWAEICYFFISIECGLHGYIFISSLGCFFLTLRFDDILSSGRGECVFFWNASLPPRVFLCWCLLLLKALPSVLCPACFSYHLKALPSHSPSSVYKSLAKFQAFSNGFVLFSSRFPFSSDYLPFVPSTSSRPYPAALFCFAPRCPLSFD